MPKFVFLLTDLALLLMLLGIAFYARHAFQSLTLRRTWAYVFRDASAMSAGVVLVLFFCLAIIDSIHFRPLLPPAVGATADTTPAYSTRTLSLLDAWLSGPRESVEKTYSVPLATHQFSKESILIDGKSMRDFPRLQYGGKHLKDPEGEWMGDIVQRSTLGLMYGAFGAMVIWLAVAWVRGARSFGAAIQNIGEMWRGQTELPWKAILLTASIVALFVGWVAALWPYYHVLGTDQTGNDVLYQAIKSIRTAVVIGSLSTLATLPLAILFGILAGYYKGRIDDGIQYLYTVLSSIPSVLLISAFVLMIQVFIDKNPTMFETGLERADVRLFLLAGILGVTGWAQLARLLRAETLKLGELDYVQAARAFGVSDGRIMRRHIMPNLTHIVVIVAVLDFSGLVLYEAVLSYVGVGVDPSTNSFGTMINGARNEMSRDPVVWWNLLTAFGFMVTLVLSMTIFASAVREAFDPRARAYRVTRTKPVKSAPLGQSTAVKAES